MVVVSIHQHELQWMMKAMVTFLPQPKGLRGGARFQPGAGGALRRWLADFHRTIPLRQTTQIK
jgi:hypothetical protein